MGTMNSQKPPGLKFFPQQSQASSPSTLGSSSLEQSLRRDRAGGTIQRGRVGQEATAPAFSKGKDGRNLRSVTGRHDLNLSHGKVGKRRSREWGLAA